MSRKIDPQDLLLWSDEAMLVANKPAGVLTIPGSGEADQTCLVDLLQAAYGPLWVVHRLDRETSGAILFARTSQAHQALNTQFERREVHKTYHALVAGRPGWDQYEARQPLLVDGDRQHRTVISSQKGKPASTSLKVLEIFHGYTLVEACPHTGYTHQIRAHLAALGFPVTGDPLYGNGVGVLLSRVKPRYKSTSDPERPLLDRVGLHARAIELHHPVSGEPVSFEAPYPRDFAVTLTQLRKYS